MKITQRKLLLSSIFFSLLFLCHFYIPAPLLGLLGDQGVIYSIFGYPLGNRAYIVGHDKVVEFTNRKSYGPALFRLPEFSLPCIFNCSGFFLLPSQVGNLTELKKFEFNSHSLIKIPPEIGQLVKLQDMSLGSKNLTQIPPEIGQLIQLKNLSLFGNMTTVPPEIGQLINLETLIVESKQLQTLPPSIWQLLNLKDLVIRGGQLTSLPPGIEQLTQLQQLTLDVPILDFI